MSIFTKQYDIESFLKGSSADFKHRSYASLLSQSNLELELRHNYIQCMFPTDEPSQFVNVPTISVSDAQKLGQNESVRMNLHLATKRMIRFYTETSHWIRRGNHNYRRISRILRCLRIFGCNKDADLFYKKVCMPVITKCCINVDQKNSAILEPKQPDCYRRRKLRIIVASFFFCVNKFHI